MLAHLQKPITLAGLATGIAEIPDFPCTWVDVQAGFRFWPNAGEGERMLIQWKEREIWRNAIEAWAIWLQ